MIKSKPTPLAQAIDNLRDANEAYRKNPSEDNAYAVNSDSRTAWSAFYCTFTMSGRSNVENLKDPLKELLEESTNLLPLDKNINFRLTMFNTLYEHGIPGVRQLIWQREYSQN
tara:strand:+ start:2207 stop:2545 length:339 start_codon:yes stop_codon:yes gene_type:complete